MSGRIANAAHEDVPVGSLAPHPRNARRGDVPAIRLSIRQHGFWGSIVAQRSTGRILIGEHRWRAAVEEGFERVPVAWVDVDDDTALKILLADNRASDRASYDDESLAALLADMAGDVGLAGTGYSDADLAGLLAGLGDGTPAREARSEPVRAEREAAPERVERGEVWQLGLHRIMCGDCRDADDVKRLLDGQQVNVGFTSPPYASQRTYDPSSGFEPIHPDRYVEWFAPVSENVAAHLAADGSWFVNIKEHCEGGQRHLYVYDLVLSHVRAWRWWLVDELVWLDAANGMPGYWPNRFKDAWERVFHFTRGAGVKFRPDAVATESDNVPVFAPERWGGLTDQGYVQREEWDRQPGMAKPSNVVRVKAGGEGGHSAAFPPALPAWFIRAFSDEGDLIFDPFMGSGSTLMAAHREQRVAAGMEISAGYCDTILHRFETATGIVPVRIEL